MTVDTIVRIASMTKAITSVAVMQLVEQGEIELDQPVGDYLPRLKEVEVLDFFQLWLINIKIVLTPRWIFTSLECRVSNR